MDLSLLEKAGLTSGESKVYIALLNLGQSSITEIVKKSMVSTSKSYDILHRLEEKGLVSHIVISGVRYFKAANPQRLKEILEDKNKEIESTINEIEKIIPELLVKQKFKEDDEEAEIYFGIKGLISVFNEETEWMKKTKKHSYAIGLTTGGKCGDKIDIFFRRMQQKRDRLKLKTKIIANKNSKGLFPYLERSKYCDIKYLNAGSEMVSINMFADKTVISIYSKNPFLLVIKSKDLYNNFKGYFDSLWKIGR